MTSAQLISELLESSSLWEDEIELNRSEFLITPAYIERNVYFVLDGCLRVFYVAEHEEHTIRFGYQNSIITSIPSYYNGKNSLFYMEAIRKTKVRPIRKAILEEYVFGSDEKVKAYVKLMEELVTQQIEREIDLLTASPIERLKRVRERSPRVFQEVPHKYIASYLRMTPETLSRILNS